MQLPLTLPYCMHMTWHWMQSIPGVANAVVPACSLRHAMCFAPCSFKAPVRDRGHVLCGPLPPRFEAVVGQLRSQGSDELWVSLGSCDLHDGRMAVLSEALAHNSTVTALDLSRNHITAAGAQVMRGAAGHACTARAAMRH